MTSDDASDPSDGSGGRTQLVRQGFVNRLQHIARRNVVLLALERKHFTPECTAATYAEFQIYMRATNEHDYHKQIYDLFHNLDLFPEAAQKYPANKSFSNQYQIDQVLGMMPPQWGWNPSQNVVMPSTDQPSTSRQPLIQGLANRPRIVPGGPTGPFPLGMYSDTQRSQQEMQLQSQNQMQYQQQSMMHQAQQNLLAVGGSVMMSADPTAGISNAASAMGVQQMNNMTTLQKQQSESPGDFILHQQQLHGKQRMHVGSCSAAPVDLTDDQREDLYRKQEFLKNTHGMQLSEIAKELLQVFVEVSLLPTQSPLCEEVLKKIRDAEYKLYELITVLNFPVDVLSINLKDKLHRFEDFIPEVVEQAKLIINQGQHFVQQQPLFPPL